MARRILVAPTNHAAGVSAACLGLVHALDTRRVAVAYSKPFAQVRKAGDDVSGELFRLATSLRPPRPIGVEAVERSLASGNLDLLMADVVGQSDELVSANRVVVFEGLSPGVEQLYSSRLNVEVASALDTQVLLIGSALDVGPARFADQAAATANLYRVRGEDRVIGAVVNRIPDAEHADAYAAALAERGIRAVALVPVHPELSYRRVGDLARDLGLRVLIEGDLNRRVGSIAIAAQSVPGFISSLVADRLIIVPGDRHEVLLSAALAESNGVGLAGLLLTAGIEPDRDVLDLCGPALESGLPILASPDKTFETAARVIGLTPEIAADDEDLARQVMTVLADCFDEEWLEELPTTDRIKRLTRAQLYFQGGRSARQGSWRIAITDGADRRVVESLQLMEAFPALHVALVADPAEVDRVATELGVELPPDATVVDPEGDPLGVGLRLLADHEVDGLVGGMDIDRGEFAARVTEAVGLDAPDGELSGAQLVMLPDEVVVFADTVFTVHPTAAQLASIAVHTAESAERLGVQARVAFIAPSTLSPTAGEERDRIEQAMIMVRQRRPDLPVVGPATFREASSRSARAGVGARNANVFIFPELSTANATIKAVQRAPGVVVAPPHLQGLRHAVNLLPRDATADHVVQMLVATALRAGSLG